MNGAAPAQVELELTNWFQPETSPAHKGVFEREIKDIGGPEVQKRKYAYWDGLYWATWCWSVDEAFQFRAHPSCIRNARWRGIAQCHQTTA